MKKPDSIDPDARICPRCGYANAQTFSVCRLCLIRLPEQQPVEQPPIERQRPVERRVLPTPITSKPLPYRSPFEKALPSIPEPIRDLSPIETVAPPIPEPARCPSPIEAAAPPTSEPIPHPSQPPVAPPPATPRWEKFRLVADGSAKLARAIIALPLSVIGALQCRIRSLVQRRSQRSRADRPNPSRPFRTRPTIAAVATKMVAQTLSRIISLILFLGEKAKTLKPRFPAWRPRFNFQMPNLDLKPAIRFGRAAFFFLAGLGGMVLKALLSALIFLLQQSRRLLKLRLRFPTVKPAINKPVINFDLRRAAKYSGVVLASLAALTILGLSFPTIQRSWASWRAAKTVPSEIKIQEDYQSASRKTLVKLEPLRVLGEPSDGLTMGVSFSYAGRSLKQEPANITLLLTSVADGFKYTKQRHLTALADGETIKLGAMNRSGQQIEVQSDGSIKAVKKVVKPRKKGNGQSTRVMETLTLNVPTATLTKISQSKEVKMKLGPTEFDLTEPHLTALRDMIERATQVQAANQRSSSSRRSR